jgi:4-amino-4-deoxy-L-arabinose transferase-like glycosyltransferase
VFTTVRRLADNITAMIATILFLCTPLFAVYATIPMPDLLETCLAGSAVLLFVYVSTEGNNGPWLLFTSGLLIGLSGLVRPFSLSIVLVLLVLFIRGIGPAKSRFFLMGASAAIPVISEFGFYWLETGDPFHGLKMDAASLHIPSSHLVGETYKGLPFFNLNLMSRWVPDSPVAVHWAVNPYLDLIFSPTVAILFWLTLLCAACLWRCRVRPPNWVVMLLTFGAVWFLTVIYAFAARPQPRYYGLLCLAVCVFSAVGIRHAILPRHRILAPVLLALYVCLSWLLISERPSTYYVEQVYLSLVAHTSAPIYAPTNVVRASSLFLLPRDHGRALAGPAPLGALALVIGNECAGYTAAKMQRLITPPRAAGAWLLGATKSWQFLPETLKNRLAEGKYPLMCLVRE